MIQRIQSIFLFLASIAIALMFFFPLANFFSENYSVQFWVIGIIKFTEFSDSININSLPLLIIVPFIALLSFTTIFLYKNRKIQLKLIKFNLLLNIVLIALYFFYYIDYIEETTFANADYLVGSFFPLISLLFLTLAFRAIRKDEKLVRSADRLR